MKSPILLTLLTFSGFQTTSGADIEAGKAKSLVCASCHGINGIGTSPLHPNLAGQKAAYIVKQLKAFKTGTRQSPAMNAFVMPLTDDDMENLGAYYESLLITEPQKTE